MSRVRPTPSRIQVVHEAGRLLVTIPTARSWVAVPFLTLWLCGWAMGEGFAIRQILSGRTPGPAQAFLAVWLLGWTVGGGAALLALLWNLVGREVITVDGRTLAVRRVIGTFGPSREYDLASITNLRAEPGPFGGLRATSSLPTSRFGAIAFDYGARTHRFGVALEGEDVTKLIDAVRERLPARSTGQW